MPAAARLLALSHQHEGAERRWQVIRMTTTQSAQRSEWFASWFDSPHYHTLYANRDEGEAARAVNTLLAYVGSISVMAWINPRLT